MRQFISKELKPGFLCGCEECLFSKEPIKYLMKKLYYPVKSFVYHKYNQVKRFIAWGCLGVQCYDFDAHNLINIIEFKLKRTEKALIDGSAIHEEKHLKALRIAVKLCKRIINESDSERAYNRHEAKWGKPEYWTTPNENQTLYSWHSCRPKAVYEKDKIQERLDYRHMIDLSDKIKLRNQTLLFNIINKYMYTWWD